MEGGGEEETRAGLSEAPSILSFPICSAGGGRRGEGGKPTLFDTPRKAPRLASYRFREAQKALAALSRQAPLGSARAISIGLPRTVLLLVAMATGVL